LLLFISDFKFARVLTALGGPIPLFTVVLVHLFL